MVRRCFLTVTRCLIVSILFYQAVSEPLNNIVQIVLENASEPFDVTEVVTVQQELLVLQILSLASSKSVFPVRANRQILVLPNYIPRASFDETIVSL